MTITQQEVLEFERRFPKYNGDKIRAVSEFFDITMAEYDRWLAAVLELPSARAYDPDLVHKIQRQRKGMQWFLARSSIVDWR